MRTGPIISPEGGIFKKRFPITIQAVTDKESPALLADMVGGKAAVKPPITNREENR
jgi:hypothetical protein